MLQNRETIPMQKNNRTEDGGKQKTEGIRINKYLSEAGVCSRRAGDREIEAGHVSVNGRCARPGDRVYPGDTVTFCGRTVVPETEEILLAFYKPRGITCTSSKKDPDNIIDYIHYPRRIYTAGRLDKDSEGLILLTNQGDLVNRMMRAGNFHEKEYLVKVDRKITDDFIRKMSEGVYLKELNVCTRKCRVKKTGDQTFRIILTQGLNRQIRRMCEELGYQVLSLKRVRIMNIRLGSLKKGTYRSLTREETDTLKKLTAQSYSAPAGSRKQKEESRTRGNEQGRGKNK